MSECEQCKSLIQDVLDDYISGCSSCYPIAMAKMQQRITELEAQLPKWVSVDDDVSFEAQQYAEHKYPIGGE